MTVRHFTSSTAASVGATSIGATSGPTSADGGPSEYGSSFGVLGRRIVCGSFAVMTIAASLAMAPVPSHPVQLTPRDGAVDIEWSTTAEADEITIRRDGMTVAELPGGTTSFRDETVVNGTLHEYELRAVVDGEAEVIAPEVGTTGVDITPPDIAATFSGRAFDGGVEVVFDADLSLEDGEVSYRVYLDGELVGVTTSLATAGRVSLAGLQNEVDHLLEVEVLDVLGNRSGRRPLWLRPRDIDPPAVPVNIRVDACGDGRVTLSWDTIGGAGGDASVSYEVREADRVVAVVDRTTAELDGLSVGVPATYTVVALDGAASANRSAPSLPLTVIATSTETSARAAGSSKLEARTPARTVQAPSAPDEIADDVTSTCIVETPEPSAQLPAPTMRLVGDPARQLTERGMAVDFIRDPKHVDAIAGYRLFVDGVLVRTGQVTGRPVAVPFQPGARRITAELIDRHGRPSPEGVLVVGQLEWSVLAMPTGVAGRPTSAGAELTWSAVAGAAGYRVDVDGSTVATVTSPSFDLRVPTPRVASVRITAVDAHGRTSLTSAPALVRTHL